MSRKSLMKCIYCLQENKKFNREHVIPEAFGVFQDNFVLTDLVCEDCNSDFGNTIDLVLARDSLEGMILRYIGKIKDPKEFKNLGRKSRMLIQVPEGPFKGAYAFISYEANVNDFALNPVPQVGFLRKTGIYDFYQLAKLPEKSTLKNDDYAWNVKDCILILPLNAKDDAVKLLESKGYGRVDSWHEGKDELKYVERMQFTWPVESTSYRAVAKIAFNYLIYQQAKHHGTDYAREFALKNDFDVIRNYIVNGIKPSFPLIKPDNVSILKNASMAVVHVVTVNWATDKRSIVAQVSLLNQIRYTICLSRNYSGIWSNIKKGHVFCPHSKEIADAVSTSLIIP